MQTQERCRSSGAECPLPGLRVVREGTMPWHRVPMGRWWRLSALCDGLADPWGCWEQVVPDS